MTSILTKEEVDFIITNLNTYERGLLRFCNDIIYTLLNLNLVSKINMTIGDVTADILLYSTSGEIIHKFILPLDSKYVFFYVYLSDKMQRKIQLSINGTINQQVNVDITLVLTPEYLIIKRKDGIHKYSMNNITINATRNPIIPSVYVETVVLWNLVIKYNNEILLTMENAHEDKIFTITDAFEKI